MSDSEEQPTESTSESLMNSLQAIQNLGIQTSSITNSFAGLSSLQMPSYKIEPLKDLEFISKSDEAIILFELLPIENLANLNTFCKEKFGNELLHIEDRIARNVCQNKAGTIDCDINLSQHVEKTKLCATYYFGNFLQLIFICQLNLIQFNNSLTGTPEEIVSKKNEKINEVQREIESNIPEEFHGLFFKNYLKSFTRPYSLPSLLVFNTFPYSHFLNENEGGMLSALSGLSSIRDKADSFLNQFAFDKLQLDSDNHLEKIGIDPTFLTGVIDKKIIVSVANLYFEHKLGHFHCRYVAFHFENPTQIFDKETIFINFVYDIALSISVEAILTKLRISLEDFQMKNISNAENEIELKFQKQENFSTKSRLDVLEEELLVYKTAILDAEERHILGFFHEEKWKSTILTGRNARSISDFFKENCDRHIEKAFTTIKHKKKRIDEQLEFIHTELQLIKDKPVINSFLKDVESDLVPQISKWKGKIEQKTIEEWLLNFDNTEDRKIALKILDRVSFVSYNDISSLCKILYNRIQNNLGVKTETCIFSHIGKITSGSAHILKSFQEENKIAQERFIPLDRITKPTEETPLILLDDFIGSGETFSKWYEKDETIKPLKKEKFQMHYCVLAAFEEGISTIKQKTNVSVLCGYIYEKSQKVREGDVFDEPTKTQIIGLIKKYSSKFSSDYLWGFDDCQLLVTLENNIPNNSIALLWWEKGWIPLFKRK